jgi:transketolase
VLGSSYACLTDLGVLSAIGGIELWAPADAIDVAAAVASLLANPRPACARAANRFRVRRSAQVPVPENGAVGALVLLATGFASHWASEAGGT